MQVSVREARPGDDEAIERVFAEAARTAWAHFIPPEELAGLSAPQRWRTETVIVSEGDGDGVVGFAVLRRSEDDGADATTGELDLIYTSPSVWGRGVGRALMTSALDRLAATATGRRRCGQLNPTRDRGGSTRWSAGGSTEHVAPRPPSARPSPRCATESPSSPARSLGSVVGHLGNEPRPIAPEARSALYRPTKQQGRPRRRPHLLGRARELNNLRWVRRTRNAQVCERLGGATATAPRPLGQVSSER